MHTGIDNGGEAPPPPASSASHVEKGPSNMVEGVCVVLSYENKLLNGPIHFKRASWCIMTFIIWDKREFNFLIATRSAGT